MTVVQPGSPPLPDNHNHKTPSQPPQYLPSVYRYTCQGAFFASTDDMPGSMGGCKGLRGRMEHVLDLEVASRADAIHNFMSQGEDVVPQEDNSGETTHSDAVQKMLEDKHAHPALVYPKQKIPPDVNDKYRENIAEMNNEPDYPFAEKVIRESWSAYGSTEIEFLQLTEVQTGFREIVAVAPYNHALVSYRDVQMQGDTPQDVHTITCLQIGFSQKLMFLLESNSTATEDDEAAPQQQQQATVAATKNKKTLEQQGQALKDSKEGHKNATDDTDDLRNATSEIPGAPSESLFSQVQKRLQQSYTWGQKTASFSEKMVAKMHSNAFWLYDNLQHDFGQRTWASSQRIVSHMPKTAALLHKTVRTMLGIGNDNDPNDKDGGSGKPS